MTTLAVDPPQTVVDESPRDPSRIQRFVRGRPEDPAWVRPTLFALLAATAVLYLWGLGASGYANTFYSAAVQAGTKSWRAFFFGSFDSSNFISVDKPPAALWVMEFSARIFGVNSWSILVPQALEGIAAVGLLYATVRRRFGASAGLIAGLVLATTPVATLMFRFNNPDALLVLLLVGAAYCVTRALEDAKTKWLVFAGLLVGFGFITKMMQAFLVVPGFGLVYLVYAQTSIKRRVGQLLAALGGIVVGAGWWLAAVSLTPAADRPYVGGSTDNSIWNLIFGYNGFGRLTGNETGSVGGQTSANGTSMWGKTGITRMFGSDFGSQISWLLPAALLLTIGTYWALRRAGRVDGRRAQVGIWASWLVVTGLTFSLGKGIIHPYYSVALAPAIGALVGVGCVALWRSRNDVICRAVMSVTMLLTVVWASHLLHETPDWHPALRIFVLFIGVIASMALLIPPSLFAKAGRYAAATIGATALIAGLAAPTAYALDTASTSHSGAIPSAGPATSGMGGPGGGHAFGGARGGFGGRGFPGATGATTNGLPGFGNSTSTGSTRPTGGFAGGRGGGGGAGGLLNAGSVSSALTTALKANASSYTWVAATIGAENASGYQLAADEPVMAIGGFNGTDPSLTLAQFEKYVTEGKIHYYIPGSAMGGGGGGGGFGNSASATGTSESSQIQSWVESHYTETTIGGTTVYDLTSSK